MKRLIFLLFIALFAFKASAQELVWHDANFKFTPGFSSEREWRVLLRKDTTTDYSFGFTYIDKDIGFVFQKVGAFKIEDKDNYILDRASLNQKYERLIIFRYNRLRSALTLWYMAFIPANHLKELQINGEPAWVKPYYNYTDTLEHNYLWGCMYGDAGNSYKAIPYLEKVRQVNPHYKDVERNLAWAYTRSNQYDKAITLLNNCLADSPGNLLFYLTLNDAYEHKKDWQMCLKTCQRGLAFTTIEKSYNKSCLAIQMGNAYSHLNNVQEAQAWWSKGRTYDSNPDRGTP